LLLELPGELDKLLASLNEGNTIRHCFFSSILLHRDLGLLGAIHQLAGPLPFDFLFN
jgi:hypothetical protein